MADTSDSGGIKGFLSAPVRGLANSMGKRALSKVTDKVSNMTERLSEYADNGGGSSLWSALTGHGGSDGGSSGKGKGSDKKPTKATNIVETIDVGVPVEVCYNQWTQFEDFPTFMKKVENVDQKTSARMSWKARVFLSHRTWEAKIIEQIPDKRIVWRSTGDKGYANGAVTFHELAPELTRIIMILEYHPQGLFERTGNIWRAQGRRARLEFKHFARHVMTQSILHSEEIQGWRGEIHDGKVTKRNTKRNTKQSTERGTAGGRNTSSTRRAAGSRTREPATSHSGTSSSRRRSTNSA